MVAMEEKIKTGHITEYSIVDQDKRIGCLKINNGVFNTIDSSEFLDIKTLGRWIEQNRLKGLVITGEGRHFSAGANIELIKQYRNNAAALEEILNQGNQILHYIENLPLVTVAAIKGVCFGAGFEIALACRYRVCTDNAVFAFPEVKLGLMPGMGGLVRFTNLVGKNLALKYILSGERIEAGLAQKMGIVEEIYEKHSLIAKAVELIDSLTGQISSQQISCIFQTMETIEEKGLYASYQVESKFFAQLNSAIGVN